MPLKLLRVVPTPGLSKKYAAVFLLPNGRQRTVRFGTASNYRYVSNPRKMHSGPALLVHEHGGRLRPSALGAAGVPRPEPLPGPDRRCRMPGLGGDVEQRPLALPLLGNTPLAAQAVDAVLYARTVCNAPSSAGSLAPRLLRVCGHASIPTERWVAGVDAIGLAVACAREPVRGRRGRWAPWRPRPWLARFIHLLAFREQVGVQLCGVDCVHVCSTRPCAACAAVVDCHRGNHTRRVPKYLVRLDTQRTKTKYM